MQGAAKTNLRDALRQAAVGAPRYIESLAPDFQPGGLLAQGLVIRTKSYRSAGRSACLPTCTMNFSDDGFRPHPQARVKRFDGEFHSYAAVLDERALERAETADAELALWASPKSSRLV